MPNFKKVLITGGASGLGQALARRYALAGWQVCITDLNDIRGQETLKELEKLAVAGAGMLYRHADVTSEDNLQAVADELDALWGGLDVLINNAGVAQGGSIEDVAISDWEWIININLLGVVRGCKVFTPIFKRQGSGHIVNIASMAGLLDVPRMASYNVSKAAVVALSGTLEQELMSDGIHVSVVCPSFFQTNLEESMRTTDPHIKKMMNKLLSSGKLSAEQVAEHIFLAVKKQETYILPHPEGRRLWLAKRYLPQRLYRKLFHRSLSRMKPKKESA